MAVIIKTVTTKYEVLTVIADSPVFVFDEFIKNRKKIGMTTRKFEHCFSCGHGFAENEGVYLASIKGVGNLFFCVDCAKKYRTENKITEAE